MTFDPKPGTQIDLNGESIEFTALEVSGPASTFVYAEAGKEGTVYKVMKDQRYYALKVFYPEYQNKRLIENTKKLYRFRGLQGFQVAERTVINRKSFPNIIDKFPELNYSVLMPWIEGALWGNLMTDNYLLEPQKYLKIAKSLTETVSNLEEQGLAHCDLSNNNFIIDQDLFSIELIDIEDMYAPDLPRPIPDVSYGTIGYRTKWIAENGLWGPNSDRFACAILCAEIITWHNKEIRDNKAGDTSFFEDDEIGEISERYHLMKSYLSKLNADLPALFEKAWFSENLDECPPVADWLNVVHRLDVSNVIIDNFSPPAPFEEIPEERKKGEGGIVHGVPPKIKLSQATVDFGLVQQDAVSTKIVIENVGGSVLEGRIETAAWIETKPSRFTIQPGDKRVILISLKSSRPKPPTGTEYRTPNALVVTSNCGSKVIGAKYKFPKPPFYKTWFGILSILIVGLFCFLGVSLIGTGALYSAGAFFSTNTPRPTATRTSPPTRTSTPTPNRQATQTQSAILRATQTQLALDLCISAIQFITYSSYQPQFCDGFRDDANDWSEELTIDEWGERTSKISSGNLLWDYTAYQGLISWNTIDDLRTYDFELTIAAQRLAGPEQTACYGLVFRENDVGFYSFKVCDDKYYAVLMSYDDSWSEIISWTTSESINPGEVNQLTVLGRDDTFQLYINGELIDSFQDDTLSSGYVVFFISLAKDDTAQFSFDNLAVFTP